MSSRSKLGLTALALLLSAVVGIHVSGATFTSSSRTKVNVTALSDWLPPIVAVSSPGATISGTTTIQATATDSPGSGVARVKIQYSPADQGTWTDLCTDTTAPYSCDWNTTTVADARYDLRAVATDNAGSTSTSAIVATRTTNGYSLVLAELPRAAKSLNLTADLVNNGLMTVSYLYFQYSAPGANNWTDVPGCGQQTWAGFYSHRDCVFTPAPGTEATYDFRAVGVSILGNKYDVQTDVTVDNRVPTGTLTVPAAPLHGVVKLSGVAADATEDGSGVDTVEFQYAATGGSWVSCGVSTSDPYTCALNTANLAGGTYNFRMIVTDLAGNVFTTATQSRVVDNTAATTSITSPDAGATVSGNSVQVSAAAFAAGGLTQVRIDASADGANWLPICTDTTAPYSCAWDTSAIVGSKTMHLRSVATATGGGFVVSDAVRVTVDNTPFKGLDVQASNVGTLGKFTAGDAITLTYSDVASLSSIKSGWTGGSTPVTLTLRNGTTDQVLFSGANLGAINTGADYLKGADVVFNATMTASTQQVNGATVTVVRVVLGAPNAGGGTLRTATSAATMVWSPSGSVTTVPGAAVSTAAVRESGTFDRDL